MSHTPGGFIWYELLTADVAAAERFYGEVVGWRVSSFDGSFEGYRILSAGETGIGGIMAIPDAAEGTMPSWFGYLHVDDIAAAAAAVLAAGGTERMPATDLPGVGRIAMLSDPQGVSFYLMQPAMRGESSAFAPGKVGHVAWNELATDDVDAGIAFYQRQFGWTRGDPVPMGDNGNYEILVRDDTPYAGAMRRLDPRLPAAWAFYFRVEDIDASAERVRAGGGQILHGPAEVPNGSRIVIALDPQGALFGLLA